MTSMNPMMPDGPTGEWLDAVGSLLTSMANAGGRSVLRPEASTFDAHSPPPITMPQYLRRLGEYCTFAEEVYVLALVYVTRRCRRTASVVHPRCVHRLYMTSLLLAGKYWDDHCCPNGFYAQVAGVPLEEVNQLERAMLLDLSYDMSFTTGEVCQFQSEIQRLTARGLKRSGSFGSSDASTEVPLEELVVDSP
mmetsp:Transcript_12878/g.32163  ORF Transcript_12878/g.32163 Transcript_12878/m.32163 type:complete len:193 (+) Transcript_12878:317-895(+)